MGTRQTSKGCSVEHQQRVRERWVMSIQSTHIQEFASFGHVNLWAIAVHPYSFRKRGAEEWGRSICPPCNTYGSGQPPLGRGTSSSFRGHCPGSVLLFTELEPKALGPRRRTPNRSPLDSFRTLDQRPALGLRPPATPPTRKGEHVKRKREMKQVIAKQAVLCFLK